jgi:hypothetical protein
MPEKIQVDDRYMRMHPELFQKEIILATVKSYQFYRHVKGKVCPYEEARKSRRPDFHGLEYNRIFGMVADYWDNHEPQLIQNQEYSMRYPDLEDMLRSEIDHGRMTQPDAAALGKVMEDDMELYEFAPDVLSRLHLNPMFNRWLEKRAATNLIEFAYNTRMIKPLTLEDLQRQVDATRASFSIGEWGDASTHIKKPMQKPPEIVAGLLRQGCRLSLSGGSKTFKSWMLLDMAISVAYGDKWLDFPTTTGPVIFVNLELPDWAVSDRLHAIACAKRGGVQPGRLLILNLRGSPTPFEQHIPHIVAKAKAIGATLIVLDPAYKLKAAVDENSTADAADVLRLIEKLSAETQAAVAYGQHFSKGNQATKESIDRISGSGVFARDPDAILTFTAHKESHSYTCEATLRTEAPLSPFVVQWGFPLMRRNYSLQAEDLKRAGGRTPKHDPKALLHFLTAEGIKPGDWEKAACSKLGIGETTFKDMRQKLNNAGLVHKDPTSGLWLASEPKIISGD